MRRWAARRVAVRSYYDDPDRPRTVFDALKRLQHDEDFIPMEPNNPTTAMPGTIEKIEVLRMRVEMGQPLWNDDDPTYFGIGKPREQ